MASFVPWSELDLDLILLLRDLWVTIPEVGVAIPRGVVPSLVAAWLLLHTAAESAQMSVVSIVCPIPPVQPIAVVLSSRVYSYKYE